PMIQLIAQESPKPPGTGNHLDIGCATGELLLKTRQQFQKSYGIDSEEKMIELADAKSDKFPGVTFQTMNMLHIGEHFPPNFFNVISCMGNTLVHLPGPKEVGRFITESRKLLSGGGRLIIQILNYQRVIEQNVTSLKDLTAGRYVFKRSYSILKDHDKVVFHGILVNRKTGKTMRSETSLYTLTKDVLHALLEQNGFTGIEHFGSLKKEPYSSESPLLITAASAG
ncbi:MAG: class I SAM-dependent methyltransferase, partial [Spirochaetia bacterium]